MRKPKVDRIECRDYGDLTCPLCGSSCILRLTSSPMIVWDYKTKEYVVLEKDIGKDGLLGGKQVKSTFKCSSCGHEWSIISGV